MGGVAPPAAPVGARSPCRAAQRRGCAAGAACPRSGYGTGSARMRRQGGWGARAGTASAPRSRWGNGGISAVVLARSGLGAAVARCSGIAARMGARPWGFLGFWGWLRGGGPCTFRVALCAFAPSPPRPLSLRAALGARAGGRAYGIGQGLAQAGHALHGCGFGVLARCRFSLPWVLVSQNGAS